MIRIKATGNYNLATMYLDRLREVAKLGVLDKYGKKGVSALAEATPKDTGLTSESWGYTIEHRRSGISIKFYNSNIQNGCPIAIILQYGHATRNGGYVEGIDYVNPAIKPIFDDIAKELEEEVRAL